MFNYTWNINQSSRIDFITDGKIKNSGGHYTNKWILSNEMIPNKICYFEIKKSHKNGCYDSFGVCKFKGTNRNGTD